MLSSPQNCLYVVIEDEIIDPTLVSDERSLRKASGKINKSNWKAIFIVVEMIIIYLYA